MDKFKVGKLRLLNNSNYIINDHLNDDSKYYNNDKRIGRHRHWSDGKHLLLATLISIFKFVCYGPPRTQKDYSTVVVGSKYSIQQRKFKCYILLRFLGILHSNILII